MSTKLRRRPRLVTWRCPECGYMTHQPRKVRVMGHLCGLGRHLVYLVRQDSDD